MGIRDLDWDWCEIEDRLRFLMNKLIKILVMVMLLPVSFGVIYGQKVVTRDINYSNTVIERKVDGVIKGISKQSVTYRRKAETVRQESDALSQYMDNLKERIINESGGKDENGEIMRADNIDAPTTIMVHKKAGDTLKNKIVGLRKILLAQVSNAQSLEKTLTLKIEANKNSKNNDKNWAEEQFNHMPALAAIALLTKFQNDVRSSELIILNRILEESK